MYPINSTQTNILFLDLVRFGFYCKNMQIQFKLNHIFLIDLGIGLSQNQTSPTREDPCQKYKI